MLVNDLIGSNRKAIKLKITKKLLDNVYSLGRMFRKLYTKQYVYITLFFLSFQVNPQRQSDGFSITVHGRVNSFQSHFLTPEQCN